MKIIEIYLIDLIKSPITYLGLITIIYAEICFYFFKFKRKEVLEKK